MLVIIGLIIGGILVGGELIHIATLNRVVTEKESFNRSALAFREKYGGLPGDFQSFTAYFTGCADNGNNHCNGDGNGIVDGVNAPTYGEPCRFWQHLILAGMLGAKLPTDFTYVNTNSGQCDPKEVPASALAGSASWQLGYCDKAGSGNGGGTTPYPSTCLGQKNYFVLETGPMFGRTMNTPRVIVTPTDAQSIDQKIDDGNPIFGTVMGGNDLTCGLQTAPFPICECLYSATPYSAGATWTYYTTFKGPGCTLAFQTDF